MPNLMRNPECDLCRFGVSRYPKNICLMSECGVDPFDEAEDIIIVAEQPTVEEDKYGRAFYGSALNTIKKYFEAAGFDPYCTYAVKCVRPTKKDKPAAEEIKACAGTYLRGQELSMSNRRHIIVMGANAYTAVMGKPTGFRDMKGNRVFVENLDAYVYVTEHQAQAMFNEDVKQKMIGDFDRFIEWIRSGEEMQKFEPPVKIVTSVEGLRKLQKRIRAAGGIIAVDCETQSLNMFDPEKNIRSIQICYDVDDGGYFIPLHIEEDCYFTDKDCIVEPFWTQEPLTEALEVLQEILLESKCIWHNGKFDRKWLYEWGKRVWGKPIIAPNTFADTLHQAHSINENRALKLKVLITTELGYPTYDIDDKLTKDLDVLIPYACRDTVATYLLALKYNDFLRQPENKDTKMVYIKLLRRADKTYTDMELAGWPVDEKRLLTSLIEVNKYITTAEEQLIDYVAEHHPDFAFEPRLCGSPKLAELLFDIMGLPLNPDKKLAYTDTEKRACSEPALSHLKEHPFIASVLEWRGLQKAKSTYIDPMLEFSRTRGKISTQYLLHGTTTGRTSSTGKDSTLIRRASDVSNGMNLQNLPYTFGIRNAIYPGGDCRIVECIHKDSRIPTLRGLIKIQNLLIGDYVMNEDGAYYLVKRVIPTGEKPLVKLTTKLGYTLPCTDNHPIRVLGMSGHTKWVTPSDLVKGDYAELSCTCHEGGLAQRRKTDLPTIEHPSNSINKQIIAPKQMTAELAYVLGFYAGNGSSEAQGKYVKVDVANTDPDILTYITELWKKLFNAPVRHVAYGNGRKATQVIVGSRGLYSFLVDSFKVKSQVPEAIWQAPVSIRAAYLRGLFDADGSVSSKNHSKVTITQKHEDFILDIQQLLLSLGIVSVKGTAKCTGYSAHKQDEVYYRISIPVAYVKTFAEVVGFHSTRKSLCLEALIATHKFKNMSIGHRPYMRARIKESHPTGVDYQILRNIMTLDRTTSRATAQRLVDSNPELAKELDLYSMVKDNLFYDEIVSIEPLPVEETYDIEVETTHKFLCNGFICHNCDNSQIELRIAGELSGDELLLACYQKGVDVHSLRARLVMGLSEEEFAALPEEERKAARQKAKAVNFGMIYGAQASTLRAYAEQQYGVVMSMEEAMIIRSTFFRDHHGLQPWYERQVAEAKELGYVTTLSGRRRHIPNIHLNPDRGRDARMKYEEACRFAINTPVQGFASDLKMMALIEINEHLKANYGDDRAYVFGEIHDSIVMCIREKYVNEIVPYALDVMAHPSIMDNMGIKLTVPLLAEAKVGISLGEAKTWKP